MEKSSCEQQSRIADINLHEMGRKELNLAEIEMPGLMSCREEFGPKKVLQGARVMGSLHVTIQTAVLVETLKELGADLRWCSCNVFSTQDQAAAALVKSESAVVFAWKGETLKDYWDLTLSALTWPDGKGPNMIVDDGGDATILLIQGLKWEKAYEKDGSLPNPETADSEDEQLLMELIKRVVLNEPGRFAKLTAELHGISEETTTGVHRLNLLEQEGVLQCPCINVNDSTTKSKFDNVYGCRHSLPDGINRSTDVMIAGKKVVICGYGDVGKGSASSMQGCNARVYVTEIDPICALQACMEGFEVVKLENVIEEADIFITTTGCKNVIMAHHMAKMKNNAIVGNIGHFDNEIDTKGLKNWPNIKHDQVKPMLDRYEFEDGHGILLLAEGRLLNLGCATGHPSFVMSSSFTNQTLAQIELWVNRESKRYEKKVYKLPKHLDEKVARLHLKALGAELTELSDDQSKYMNIPKEGPFKNEYYRY